MQTNLHLHSFIEVLLYVNKNFDTNSTYFTLQKANNHSAITTTTKITPILFLRDQRMWFLWFRQQMAPLMGQTTGAM